MFLPVRLLPPIGVLAVCMHVKFSYDVVIAHCISCLNCKFGLYAYVLRMKAPFFVHWCAKHKEK